MSPMAISPLVTLFVSMFLVLQVTTNAFNITEILNPYREFGEYNSYLTETAIANDINNQKAVTVLVVSDDQLYYFKHLSGDVVKSIMNFHVLLGYYDESKLKSLKSRTILATFNQEATLTVDHDSSGSITFKSAHSGTNMGVKLISTIQTLPPSISVLRIETTIKTNGGSDNSVPPPSSTPPQQPPLNPPTGWTASPPRKALAPPPDSRNKMPLIPISSPNTTSNTPPPASSPSNKGNNNAPCSSKTKPSSAPSSQTPSKSNSTSPSPDASPPSKSLGPTSSDHESSVASPPKPSNTPPAAEVQSPGSGEKSSAHARISYRNYLGSILVVFSAVWFLFIMS